MSDSFPELPAAATSAAARFATDHYELASFVGFVADLALRSDEVRRQAVEALADGDRIAGRPIKDYAIDESATAVAALRKHRQVLLQMAYCRGVDNFLTYITDLLHAVYVAQPGTLHAKAATRRGEVPESVPLDTILEHATMDDLLASLVERRVNDLSFKGIRALADYLSDRLAFDLFDSQDDLQRAVRIVEIRNLIAHNRGVVNRLFLARVADSDESTLGQPIVLDIDRLLNDLNFIVRSAFDTDIRAAEKWGLPTRRFPEGATQTASPQG